MSDDYDPQDWQVVDHTNERIHKKDSRSDAESTQNQFGDQLDITIARPGENPRGNSSKTAVSRRLTNPT